MADQEPGLHLDLRRDYRSTLLGALLIFGLPGLAVLVGVVALRPRTPSIEQVRSLAYALPGALLLFGAGFMARSAAWYRRSTGVYYSRPAVPMRMRAWRSRSGGLLLELHRVSDAAFHEVQIRIQPQAPRWDTTGLEEQVVKVHLDDDPAGPVVVETARGILWPAPLSRRQNRVEGRLQ